MGGIVTMDDADALADAFARRTRMDGVARPNVRVAARRAGYQILRAPPRVRWGEPAQWARVGTERRIYLNPRADDAGLAHPIAHECAHCLLDELGLRVDGDIERWCHRFAAAFLCPGVAARRVWRRAGGDLDAFLGAWRHVPGTAVALRVQEAVGLPTFVLVGSTPRYPPHDVPLEVVRAASTALRKGRVVGPGLQAIRLRDEPRRVAVVVEADAA